MRYSLTGKAKAAGAGQARQSLLPTTGGCSAPPGEPGPSHGLGTGKTNTLAPSSLLPPSPALHAGHGAVGSGAPLGQWGLSCAPSQLPVPPSPMLAMGTEQSWALCRPSPAQLARGVLSALPGVQTPAQQHPSCCCCRKRAPGPAKPSALEKLLHAFYFF